MVKNIRIKPKRRDAMVNIPVIDHFKLMDQTEIQTYKGLFTNIQQVKREIEAVRICLVNCELPDFRTKFTQEEHKKAVAKFTQLFKTLLELKHTFEVN